MKRPEQELQKTCVRWFRMQYPNAIIHHSPNGGWRTKTEGAILKAMGVVAGFPDLMIIWYSRVLLIEMKADSGKLTDNQKTCHELLSRCGLHTEVCRTFDEFQEVVKRFILPL